MLQKNIASALRLAIPFCNADGYARVSTENQHTAAQMVALKADGCEHICRDTTSGGRRNRAELHRLLNQLHKGDAV